MYDFEQERGSSKLILSYKNCKGTAMIFSYKY